MQNSNKTNGNAAIVVIFLLLIAGAAAWWFLFRMPSDTMLPGEYKHQDTQSGSASSSGAKMERGGARETDAGSYSGSQASSASDLSPTDHADIDWKARHEELKKKFSSEFVEPKIGMQAKVLLASGRVADGIINDLSDDSITIRIVGTGKATYSRSQISQSSQLAFFKDVFADYSARKQIADEKADMNSVAPAPQQ